jgi:hypothetical protein
MEEEHKLRSLEAAAKDAELAANAESTAAADKDSEVAKRAEMKRKSMKRRASTAKLGGKVEVPTLEAIKVKILDGAAELEKHGLCSAANNYQELLNAVAQDIRNQRTYRRQRKQELAKLRDTVKQLDEKKAHMDSQIESFELYIESCMAQLTKKKTKTKKGLFGKKKGKSSDEKFHAGSYKYSAQRLMDKGVLMDVKDIDPSGSKLRNVSITVSCHQAGIFTFDATILGVTMEKEEISFQELLQNQYNNVTTMTMFTYCTINVNLVIHLINKKFYNK